MIEDQFEDTGFEAPKDRWLLSYADLVTLLLAFFVVMYSVSAVNDAKLSELATTLSDSFNPGQAEAEEVLSQQKMLDVMLGNFPGEVELDSTQTSAAILLSLPGELLFESGGSEITLAGKRQLLTLLPTLKHSTGAIFVEGHTDNLPISTAKFPSNWELSAHRAAATVRFLETQGVASKDLRAVGFSDAEPVDSNATEVGRQRHRRVVLRVESVDWQSLQAVTEVMLDHEVEELSLDDVDPALLEEVLRELDSEGT